MIKLIKNDLSVAMFFFLLKLNTLFGLLKTEELKKHISIEMEHVETKTTTLSCYTIRSLKKSAG